MKLALSALSLLLAAGPSPAQTITPVPGQRALVNQFCVACHNDKLSSSGFSWTKLDLAHPEQDSDLAERVIRKLRAGLMPPAGAPRPNAAILKSLAAGMEANVDRAATLHPNPGRAPLHRLNRAEYANSIRDLLALEIDTGALLPPDDMSHGFDNMADVLTVSPALMDGYIRAAGKISRLAVGDPAAGPAMMTFHISRGISQMRHMEGTPFGTRGGIAMVHNFPADGEYIFKMTFYSSVDGPLFGQNQGKGQQIEVAVNGARAALLDIDPQMKSTDDVRTPPIKVKGGPQRISAAFIQKFDGPLEDDVMPIELSLADTNLAAFPGVTSLPHLSDLSITGPFHATGISDTPSRRKVFACHPESRTDELPCARTIFTRLLRQAYRRPVAEADVRDLLAFYERGRTDGGFEAGIAAGLQAMIANPKFVFRFEPVPPNLPPNTNYRVGDLELASRLSYFLWSSAPDEELITLASRHKLQEPVVLSGQVRRMLADPRSSTLSTRFAAQWLHLQNLKDAQPDDFIYPNFSVNIATSMRRETELLFDNLIRENRGILELLDANYTFVDEVLAKHYGIPNVLGNRFRKVEVTDENRRGILGQGSFLTLTSITTRTSPVARGKYVMEVLLGTPPPAPPANVPPLKDGPEGGKINSVRESMEAHRKQEPCRSCHQMMDPIGFALENYDAIGLWREKDNGVKIDASGRLFDGTKLTGPGDLRRALLARSDAFMGGFAESLLAYAAGRVLQPTDMPAVRSIERDAARDGNRVPAFIMAVVNSAPFRMSRTEGVQPGEPTAKSYRRETVH